MVDTQLYNVWYQCNARDTMVFIYDCTDNAHCYFNGFDDAL